MTASTDTNSPMARDPRRVRSVVILGGGTAGWMTAAALSRQFGRALRITLLESEEIGTVGVGEATIPTIHWFNELIGLDEAAFLSETKASFKLGIEFVDWVRPGHRYFHPFGEYGVRFPGVAFHHRWMKARAEGVDLPLSAFSLATELARQGRFAMPTGDARSILSTLGYAYHFDASLYAKHLRGLAEAAGVTRVEGRLQDVERDAESGLITALTTQRGERIEGELFIDCSGFRALLIDGTMGGGFEDWSHWLPCDRAVAVPCARTEHTTPFTRSTARPAGWQWRIPLQHRIGNGHVFSSRFMGEDEATAMLLANLDGEALAEPRTLRFTAGTRREAWIGNVVAIGLSSGFLEPLESTSIHLIQSGIAKLLTLFPDRDMDPMLAARYNALLNADMDNIKDFLILHYHANPGRSDPFWVERREMALPETLVAREEQYRRSGRLMLGPEELFRDASWLAVLNGQEIVAEDYNPLADVLDSAANSTQVRQVAEVIQRAAPTLPLHDAALAAAMGG
ncbi:tryptophan 7-halogenase [Sphingomonas sp. CBMAI 2297]|uniref:tryptophan halogenase family protein n=1 Tax=Sphingomonas sp. CBMAI 2297 TaxID=2991720 RepID=UPI0024556B86|nr:tryptophan 7-halogenase [Sphingomonas sp. CBMAI 2297]MDH4743654.1 tryptophan 7-halogenase [Sphingomonas sp. CBMAI 2297]